MFVGSFTLDAGVITANCQPLTAAAAVLVVASTALLSCSHVQVYWDADACREYARVIWASQSAAQQRAGRTGRTCAGTCYRLMRRQAFNALPK